MRLDATTKADVLVKLFGIGVKTTNEGRAMYDAKFPVKGGHRAFVPVNVQPIDNLISEQPATTDNNNQIDNKLKA